MEVHTWFALAAGWTWRGFLPHCDKGPASQKGKSRQCRRAGVTIVGSCRLAGSHVVLRAGHDSIPGPALQHVVGCLWGLCPLDELLCLNVGMPLDMPLGACRPPLLVRPLLSCLLSLPVRAACSQPDPLTGLPGGLPRPPHWYVVGTWDIFMQRMNESMDEQMDEKVVNCFGQPLSRRGEIMFQVAAAGPALGLRRN